MSDWLKDLLTAGGIAIAIPIILRMLPNKKLLQWGQWLSLKIERGRYQLYKLAYKLGALVSKTGNNKLGKKIWEKLEAGTIEAIISGFIRSEEKMPWSGPLAISFGLLDGLNFDEENYQKRGPGVEVPVVRTSPID